MHIFSWQVRYSYRVYVCLRSITSATLNKMRFMYFSKVDARPLVCAEGWPEDQQCGPATQLNGERLGAGKAASSGEFDAFYLIWFDSNVSTCDRFSYSFRLAVLAGTFWAQNTAVSRQTNCRSILQKPINFWDGYAFWVASLFVWRGAGEQAHNWLAPIWIWQRRIFDFVQSLRERNTFGFGYSISGAPLSSFVRIIQWC